jgi:hypothetical protein
VVSNRFNYEPAKGFYDVPNKGFITWIGSFRTIAVSDPMVIGAVHHIAYIFEAIEDNPPPGLNPIRPKGNNAPGIIY